jgi:transcriptional regulator with XRE-family HTH domain
MEVLMERLAEIREHRALTLRELGELSGVDANTINQIELGRRKARPSTIRKLARALGVEPEELKAEPIAPKGQTPLSHEELAAEEGREEEAQAERRCLIPLLDSYTLILTELSNGHGPRIANISEDLSPSRAFMVYQWVGEFIYTCNLIEHALDEKGVMEVVGSLLDRASEGEHVPGDLLQKAREFGKAHHKLFVDVEVSAHEWVESQFGRPEVMEFSNKEKREADKRLAKALGNDNVVKAADASDLADVRPVSYITDAHRIRREKVEASRRRTRAEDTG